MLVFTRNPGQSFMIGDNVKITLLENNRGQSKIGIEAPKGISIHRSEIYEKIQLEKNRIKEIYEKIRQEKQDGYEEENL